MTPDELRTIVTEAVAAEVAPLRRALEDRPRRVPIDRAAAMLSVSRRTVERMIEKGRIRATRDTDGLRYIPVSEIDRVVEFGA